MKKTIRPFLASFIALLVSLPSFILSQQFTRLTTGPVVTTPSGSRSCNWLDYNQDGFQDLLITNGTSGGENNFLYHNNGDGTFSAVSNIVSSDGTPTDGATCADFNNTGEIDICAVNWYNVSNLLYQLSFGTFLKIDTGIVVNDQGYSETAAWGDMDGNGFVDLLVTNSAGNRRNFLYRNWGGNTFEKITLGAPVTDAFYSRGVSWIDIDLDGDQDLFITNENQQANNLYLNDGVSNFTPVLNDPVVSDNLTSMSSSWGDIDNDGDFDLVVANQNSENQLFLNDGSGNFTEVNSPFGPDIDCAFSSSFADYDNDGDLDLFITNGYCSPNLKNRLYKNDGTGGFTRVLNEPMAIDSGSSYGCAWADYNNDGFQDLVVANWQGETQPNSLYLNNGNANHWMKIRLTGRFANESAIGARVRCRAMINGQPVWQTREVSSQTGYCSQNSLVVHFGLGNAATVDSLQVYWPYGDLQEFTNLSTDQTYFLIETERRIQ